MAHSAIGSGETPADPIALDLVDIQRNVVRALPVDKACYYFIRITNPGGFREFLAALLADKAATRDPGDRSFPCFSINIGFTCAGLERLQVNQAIIDSFPQVFRDGMAARADQLGDAGPSAAPQYWDGWLGSADIHCVVCLSAAPASALGDLQTRLGLGQEPRWSGFEILHTESGEWLRDGDDRREHFGFRDGLGQPKVAVKWSPAAGDLVDARENLVAAGEFILGYYDEDKYRQPNPIDPAMARNGTYMVFRKLAQDVAGFRQFIKDHARSRD